MIFLSASTWETNFFKLLFTIITENVTQMYGARNDSWILLSVIILIVLGIFMIWTITRIFLQIALCIFIQIQPDIDNLHSLQKLSIKIKKSLKIYITSLLILSKFRKHTGINWSYLSSLIEIAVELVSPHCLVEQVHGVRWMGFHCVGEKTRPTFYNGLTV